MPTIIWNNYLKMRKTQPKPIKFDSKKGSVHFICYPKPKKEEKMAEILTIKKVIEQCTRFKDKNGKHENEELLYVSK